MCIFTDADDNIAGLQRAVPRCRRGDDATRVVVVCIVWRLRSKEMDRIVGGEREVERRVRFRTEVPEELGGSTDSIAVTSCTRDEK